MKTESKQPDLTINDAPAMAGTLQELLSEISDRVNLADDRYADIVGQMQEKLAALELLAKSTREKAAEEARREAEAEAKRIVEAEDRRQAEAEAKRQADAEVEERKRSEASLRRAEQDAEKEQLSRMAESAKAAAIAAIEKSKARVYALDVDPFDIIDHAPAPRTREPWDDESADVFARHFDQFASPVAVPARYSEPEFALDRRHGPPGADRAWLDGRFNDIAARIAEMMAASPATAIDHRFDSLEVRIDAAVTTVTTQVSTGSDTLKSIESHIAEIDEHVEYIRTELSRLDTVEEQIRALMDKQTGGEPDADVLENVANERAADPAGIGQLTVLLQRLMSERQHTEEHTVSMLDTLQQAMIRVLDRIEVIEGGGASGHIGEDPHEDDKIDEHAESLKAAEGIEAALQQAAPQQSAAPRQSLPQQQVSSYPQQAPTHHPHVHLTSSSDSFFADLLDEDALASQARAADNAAMAMATPELQSSILQIRQNFIADQRARPRLGANGQPMQQPQQPQPGATQRPAAPRRTLLDRILHPTSRQLAIAALGLMLPLNCGFLYLMLGGSRPHVETELQAATGSRDEPQTASHLTEASQAQASEPTISQAEDLASASEGLSRISPPARAAEQISLQEPVAPAPTEQPSRLELPPATVGPLTLRRAAANGDASAQFEVGARLAEGKGIDQNFKSAVDWYLRAATQGFAQAQYRIGTHYERGLGVDKDVERARVWYQRAAEQGNVKAMHNLAVLSTNRPDGKPDYTEALRWFTQAAQFNLSDSQFNLAVLHENGLGVDKDLKTAYFYFSLAARSGDKEAVKRREAVKAQLSADALVAADEEIRTFRPKPQLPQINDARVAGEMWKKRQTSAN